MVIITREQIIEKVKREDTNFFYGLYNGDLEGHSYKDINKEVKTVYDQHYGDGNEWTIALEFVEYGMYVLLEGCYSSWDSPEWYSVDHTETRFKEATLEYIRDKKIDEVLKTEEN